MYAHRRPAIHPGGGGQSPEPTAFYLVQQLLTDELAHCTTVSEAARLLHISRATVWRWIDSAHLAAYRVGPHAIRIRRSDVAALLVPGRTAFRAAVGTGLALASRAVFSGGRGKHARRRSQ